MIKNFILYHGICLNPAIIPIDIKYETYSAIHRIFTESAISGRFFHFIKVYGEGLGI